MSSIRPTRFPSHAAAERAFVIAQSHCNSCHAYHAVWPYLRLLKDQRGVDADRDLLEPMLARLLAPGARVLLAGSADAGLAELVLDAANRRPIELTVVDICDTPLIQCREIEDLPAGSTITVERGTISGSQGLGQFDLVVAHSVLAFLDEKELSSTAAFISSSLAPGGHFLLATGLSSKCVSLDVDAFCQNVLTQMAELGVPLPCPQEVFEDLLRGYAKLRRKRKNPFADQDSLLSWLHASGFEPIEVHAKRRGTAVLADGSVRSRSTEGAVVLSRKQKQR